MGDRSNCTKLDRTNGYDDSRDYMRVKKSKLAQQNDQIREALRIRNNSSKTDLFKGISINVNGRTQPTADELKRLILLNGGDYHPYYRYQTTKFMIATNLSTARIKKLRPDDRVVKPEWITESIQAKCLLPYQDYQLFVEEPRGKSGSVLAIESSIQATSNQPTSVVASYRSNYRKGKGKPEVITKSKDIREMFSRSVRNPHSAIESSVQSTSYQLNNSVDSDHGAQTKCLVPYEDYQVFIEEPLQKSSSLPALGSAKQSTSNQSARVVLSHRSNSRKGKVKQEATTKSKDIREMLLVSIRNPNRNPSLRSGLDDK